MHRWIGRSFSSSDRTDPSPVHQAIARLRARTNARTSLALRPVNCPPVPTFRMPGRARVTGVTEHLIGTGRLHVPVHTARHDSHQRPGDAVNRLAHPPRPTPTAEINVQYAAFVADFSLVEVVSSASVPGIAQSSTAAVFPTTSPIARGRWRSTWSFTSTAFRSSFPRSTHHPTLRPSGGRSSLTSISRWQRQPDQHRGIAPDHPLPTTASMDLTIYNTAVLAAIEQSRQRASWGADPDVRRQAANCRPAASQSAGDRRQRLGRRLGSRDRPP